MIALLYDPVLALAFYGGLVALALWATWHEADFRLVGIMLAAGFIMSNLVKASVPIHSQVGPYSFIEVLVAMTAFFAWGLHRSWQLIGIVALSLASIGANIAFSIYYPPSKQQIFLWEVTTNVCFAGECLLATWLGIAHGYRVGRFTRRLRAGRGAAQPDAAREGGP